MRLGIYKWQRAVIPAGFQFSRQEVHPSGIFCGTPIEATAEAKRRGIKASDGWLLTYA